MTMNCAKCDAEILSKKDTIVGYTGYSMIAKIVLFHRKCFPNELIGKKLAGWFNLSEMKKLKKMYPKILLPLCYTVETNNLNKIKYKEYLAMGLMATLFLFIVYLGLPNIEENILPIIGLASIFMLAFIPAILVLIDIRKIEALPDV